jgi:hypothetical protein
MTVYVDVNIYCFIVNCINNKTVYKDNEIKEVSLKKTRKYYLEIQVPIQTIGTFIKKDKTNIDLAMLNRLLS